MAAVNFFKNKTVLITNASSGIGKALIYELTQYKSDIIMIDKSKELLNKIIQDINQSKKKVGRLIPIIADISTKEGCDIILRDAKKAGGFEILINIGSSLYPAKFEDIKPEMIKQLIDNNIYSIINLTRLSIPILKNFKKPGIINISNFYGKVGVPYFSIYCASQFAIAGFSEALQREYAGEQLRIMNVFLAGIKSEQQSDMEEKLQKLNFTFDKPEKVAPLIVQAYNNMKKELILGKMEKSLNFWNNFSKESVNNKFKKIKTKILNAIAGF